MTNTDLPGVRRPWLSIVAALAAAWLAGPIDSFGQAPTDSPRVVRRAAQLADAFESQEAGEDPGARVPSAEAIGTAYRSLQDHVTTNTNDLPALIVLARLVRALTLLEPVVIAGGEVQPSSAPRPAQAVAALNQVLGIEPDNAEAHYWLGRVYGLTAPGIAANRVTRGPLDLEQAIAHARRAVELAPTEPAYREALGIYLATAQRYTDAIDAFAGDTSHVHLLRLILEDFEAIPLPPEATYLAHDSAVMADSLPSNPRFAIYPQFRVRVYVVDGAKSVFEAEFRRKWPALELYEMLRVKAEDGSETIGFMQALQEHDGALQPAAEQELARATRTQSDPEGNVIIAVQEIVNPSQETRERFELVGTDRLTLLTLINQRTLE